MKNWKINFCPLFTSSFTSFYTYIIIYITIYSKTWLLSIIYIIIYLHQYLHHILQQNLSFKFTCFLHWFLTVIAVVCLIQYICTSKFTYNPKIINRKNGWMLGQKLEILAILMAGIGKFLYIWESTNTKVVI